MEWSNGASKTTGNSDNIFIDKAKILTCDITYGVKKDWQTYADDISIELTLDIGKDFNPTFYMGGKFKIDEESGLVVGWSTAYKIKLFFEALGKVIILKKNTHKQDNKLPDGADQVCVGAEFKRLMYKSTKIKANGDNLWKDWQETRSVDTSNEEFKAAFTNAVDNGWIKDFLKPGNDVPFEASLEEVAEMVTDTHKDMPL